MRNGSRQTFAQSWGSSRRVGEKRALASLPPTIFKTHHFTRLRQMVGGASGAGACCSAHPTTLEFLVLPSKLWRVPLRKKEFSIAERVGIGLPMSVDFGDQLRVQIN